MLIISPEVQDVRDGGKGVLLGRGSLTVNVSPRTLEGRRRKIGGNGPGVAGILNPCGILIVSLQPACSNIFSMPVSRRQSWNTKLLFAEICLRCIVIWNSWIWKEVVNPYGVTVLFPSQSCFWFLVSMGAQGGMCFVQHPSQLGRVCCRSSSLYIFSFPLAYVSSYSAIITE